MCYPRLLAPLMLCMAIIVLSGCGSDDGGTGTGGPDDEGFKQTTAGGVTFKWKVEDPDLLVKLSASTTGWVSVGFDPTSRMRDANIIIGYVSGSTVSVRDDYGSGPTAHQADTSGGGTDDVSDAGGSESGGVTEVTFSIPLDSGDQRDRPLTEGNTYTIILGRGPDGSDGFSALHSARATATITL